ncbi:EamA family transporter [Flavobacteriaceae bacterium S0862]|nr:EamA family transporter [Flavobacteriaceae bacterium S0862]
MQKSRDTVLIVLAFFAIYVIWGSTYLLNKIAVSEISPLYLASIRFTVAGLLIFLTAKLLGHSLAINKRQLINSIIAGFLFLTYGNGVFVWALKYVDSGFAALEASTQPLIILVLMRLIDGKKIKLMSVIGVVLGVVGIYLLVSQKGITADKESIFSIIMIFTCVVSWSYGSIFVAKAQLPSKYLISTGYQMVSGGLLLLIFSALLGEKWLSPLQWNSSTQISMFLLIIFGGIVAFTAFNYLLKKVSAEKVATSAYVNPIIALLLGWYILDEQITGQSIIAAIVLLTGVYFINTKRIIRPRITGR